MTFLQRIPFPGALAILAAGTAAGVYASARTHEWWWLVAALAIVAVVAVLYLREYAQLPGPESAPRPRTTPPEPGTAPGSAATAEREASVPDPSSEGAGPVEVDKFDPEYDPVAEADRLEASEPKPRPPEP